MASVTDRAAPGQRAGAGTLRVDGLHSGYGRVTVLHGVGFTLAPGTVLGISGPNGAGKSTLLKTIAGLLAASAGEVTLDGESMLRHRPHRRVAAGLALVPEGRQVIGSLSVESNLAMTLMARRRLRPDAEHRRRLKEVLGLFPRLEERLGLSAAMLSGGEQQMLAIGRALMTAPRVLLLDEPSQGLAENVVAGVTEALRSLKGGLSMIIVEQNADVLDALADARISLRLGRIHDGGGGPGAGTAVTEVKVNDSVQPNEGGTNPAGPATTPGSAGGPGQQP
jgi:branched-chain amino acid transport system ATP-binding protein